MTHTEESLIALSEACTVAAAKASYLGATNYSESVDALRLAIREVLVERDAATAKMQREKLDIVDRAEKAEAECERLRAMIRNLCMDHVDNCRCTYCKAAFRFDFTMKGQP
jgi:hypothetical protein